MLLIKSFTTILFITAILSNIANGADRTKMLNLVNAERRKVNLPDLRLDSQLNNAAQKHTDYMARTNILSHYENSQDPGVRIKAQGYNWSTYGENIAQGQLTEDEVMKAWMSDPPHRDNILGKMFKHLGVGYSSQGNFWTQDFAAPL
ncbi:2485_t:CDS:2 [Dentiscutata heterogama]|uniref:2485_t:CDS:1 n=1 Tax=Dentiscutata heterogama TaxID=1316150 RepID=A0ACA9K486_9GLOM|nr:2485_t:CDS:2 [Dentiscutata heterogama]